MSSTTTITTYLITGATRGIGKGLFTHYASQPNNIVIAGVRDPTSAASKALADISKGHNSEVIVVKLDSASESDAATAIKTLQSSHSISQLDVVIANAGIATVAEPVATASAASLYEHVAVNTIGPLVLFQAVRPLLQKSSLPKFVLISSASASIGAMEPYPTFAYGASKAMANFMVRKMHVEEKWLVAFALHPGFVQTDMGNRGAQAFGLEEAPTTIDESVTGLVAAIDTSSRFTSGKFLAFDGADMIW